MDLYLFLKRVSVLADASHGRLVFVAWDWHGGLFDVRDQTKRGSEEWQKRVRPHY